MLFVPTLRANLKIQPHVEEGRAPAPAWMAILTKPFRFLRYILSCEGLPVKKMPADNQPGVRQCAATKHKTNSLDTTRSY